MIDVRNAEQSLISSGRKMLPHPRWRHSLAQGRLTAQNRLLLKSVTGIPSYPSLYLTARIPEGMEFFVVVLNVKYIMLEYPLLNICYLALNDIFDVHQFSWKYDIRVSILTTEETTTKIVLQRVCIPKYM